MSVNTIWRRNRLNRVSAIRGEKGYGSSRTLSRQNCPTCGPETLLRGVVCACGWQIPFTPVVNEGARMRRTSACAKAKGR